MAKRYAKRATCSLKHKCGNVYKTDYDLGWDLWYTHKPLPLGAARNTQQGYVKAAKSADKCLMASMRHAERKGVFFFLPKWTHLSYESGNTLSCGAESRMSVRRARASVEQVKLAAA